MNRFFLLFGFFASASDCSSPINKPADFIFELEPPLTSQPTTQPFDLMEDDKNIQLRFEILKMRIQIIKLEMRLDYLEGVIRTLMTPTLPPRIEQIPLEIKI